MQTMAISLADSLGRTTRGDQELAQAQNGLSVAQRKLLSQLNTPGTLENIARDNGWDAEYANKTAARLVELGLVTATAGARPEEESRSDGTAMVLPIGRAAPKLSKPWPAAAGAAVVLAAVGVWWAVSSDSSSSVQKMAQAPSGKPAAQTPPAPAEKPAAVAAKDTELPKAVYSMTLQQPQAPIPVAAPAAASPAPPPAALPAPKPAAPAVATRGLAPSAAAKPAPEPAAAAQVAAPTAALPTPPSPVETPAKTVVAAAAPSAAEAPKPATPAAVERALKIVQREEPNFPREAILASVSKGTVKARLTVDGTGSVAKVDILEASPRRVFDREVQRTLTRWKFEPTGQTQTADTEISFNRE